MDEERLEALLEETTVDCYGEYEEFTGVMCTLGEKLRFPLKATVVGEVVEVVGIDERRSDLRRGVVARVRRGDQEYLWAWPSWSLWTRIRPVRSG